MHARERGCNYGCTEAFSNDLIKCRRIVMSDGCIIANCMKIARSHFLYTPYKNDDIVDWYKVDGVANKASGICHYCTIDTLNAILEGNCLRFTDIRFLNDSTEFIEVISLIKQVLSREDYTSDFKNLLLNSDEIHELENYKQSYVGFSRRDHDYRKIDYHTYTCSFSTNSDSLSMWNYYATTAAGVNVVFDFAWNMFDGSEKTEVTIGEKLSNDIMLFRGLIVYSIEDKKKCITELLDRLAQIFEEAGSDLDKYKSYILYAFKEAINNMRCFFKNNSFDSENEYRVVLKIPEDLLQTETLTEGIKNKGVFKRGNILIPYVDYEFKPESIIRITINPYDKESDSMFELGIKNLLWMKELEKVKIIHSNIPIRKYD